MSSVLGWDMAALVIGESSFGVVPDPVTGGSFECIDFDAGVGVAVGEVRGKKDRGPGRDMQNGFVEGRVKPLPWMLEASVKSRAAVDTVPRESALYRGAGMTQTVNGGTSVVYTLPGAPLETANSFASLSMTRLFGKSPYVYQAEQLRGAVVKTLEWSGGDSELIVKASGEAADKYLMGYEASVSLVDGSGTTLTLGSAEIAYRFGLGFYQIENEVIRVTAMPSTTTRTIARAQLGTTGAAHTAVPIRPYIPTLSYAGVPIGEGGVVTVIVDGITLEAMSFGITLTSGMDHGPGESGSKYVQRAIAKKNELSLRLKMLLSHDDGVSLLGKARDRNTVAVTIVQSHSATLAGLAVAGSVNTFALPYCEVGAFKVPASQNDAAIVDVPFRVRGNAGNDAFTLTMT